MGDGKRRQGLLGRQSCYNIWASIDELATPDHGPPQFHCVSSLDHLQARLDGALVMETQRKLLTFLIPWLCWLHTEHNG